MHYCFFSVGSWQYNASQMRLRELGAELIARGVRVTYVLDDVPFNRSGAELPAKAEAAFVSPSRGWGQFAARREAIRRVRSDFVHVLNPSPKAYLTLRPMKDMPRLVADWDEWRARFPWPWPLWKRYSLRIIDRWHRSRASLLLVASRYMQRGFAQRFGVTPVYLPYAAYLHDVPLDVPSPFAVPTAVYMGTLYQNYDQDVVFHAAALLKKRGISVPIEFIGGGPESQYWEQFGRKQGLEKVRLRGYVSQREMWACLRHAQVLVFPIRPSLVNLARCPAKTYAFAQARRPVITCRVGEVPEVLGEQPTYVEPTAEAFAAAIEAAMSVPRPPDVDYGIERHNWKARVDTLLAALGPLA